MKENICFVWHRFVGCCPRCSWCRQHFGNLIWFNFQMTFYWQFLFYFVYFLEAVSKENQKLKKNFVHKASINIAHHWFVKEHSFVGLWCHGKLEATGSSKMLAAFSLNTCQTAEAVVFFKLLSLLKDYHWFISSFILLQNITLFCSHIGAGMDQLV